LVAGPVPVLLIVNVTSPAFDVQLPTIVRAGFIHLVMSATTVREASFALENVKLVEGTAPVSVYEIVWLLPAGMVTVPLFTVTPASFLIS
jgi:hypothetical protein